MRILVAIDGSECSTRALDYVANRLWEQEDQFMILSVVEPVPSEYGMGAMPPPVGSIEDRIFDECAEISGNGSRRLQEALPFNAVHVRVESGLVAETICDTASRWEADLIVLGSQGRKGIAHFLLGSVAEEVLKKASCSVEVIKEKGHVTSSPEKSQFMHTN
jgi:nucleotide-binding universal stress UspA family protein